MREDVSPQRPLRPQREDGAALAMCIPVRTPGKPDEAAPAAQVPAAQVPAVQAAPAVQALCSVEDYEFLAGMTWKLRKGYARTSLRVHGQRVYPVMHRMVYERMTGQAVPSTVQVDHINGNRLDNRRENLRPVDNQRNQQNTKPNSTWRGKPVRSLYKGVFWHHKGKKWEAKIGMNGRNKYLGLYATEEEAALAYDRAAREHFGEYARCNIGIVEESVS